MRRWFLIFVLSIAVLGGAAWFSLPYVTQWVVARYAGEAGLEDFKIRLRDIGLRRARASDLGFTVDTEHGPVQISLEDITVQYDLREHGLTKVTAARGTVRWRYQPSPAPAQPAPVTLPALPALRSSVKELQISAKTPLGEFLALGGFSATTDPVHGVQAEFLGKTTRLHTTLSADGSRLSLQLDDAERRRVLSAEISEPLGLDTEVSLSSDLLLMKSWLPAHLQSDPLSARKQIGAIGLAKGALDIRARFDPATATWLVPGLRAQWGGLSYQDINSAGALALGTTTTARGIQAEVTADSFVTVSGAALPDLIGGIRLDITAGNTVTIDSSGERLLALGSGPIHWRTENAEEQLSGKLLAWRLAGLGESSLELQNINLEPRHIGIGAARITATSSVPWSPGRGTLKINGLSLGSGNRRMRADLTGAWSYAENKFTAGGSGAIQGTELAQWRVSAQPARGEGSAQATFSTDAKTVSGLVTGLHPLVATLALRNGQLSGRVDLYWNAQRTAATADAEVRALDAKVFEAEIRGATASIKVTDLINLSTDFAVSIPEVKTATNLDIRRISVNGSRRGDVIDINDARLEALGGAFNLEPGQLTLGKDSTLVLKVSGLALESVFQTLDVDGLSGSGHLHGEVPILIYADGIEITDSKLETDGTGFLKYLPGGEVPTPELDNIALKALRDFRYDSMTVNLNYTRNGDYHVRARLKGHNPELYNGYPIAFNINLNGNLPGMLRAAVLTGDFDKEVLKQVQSEAFKTPPGSKEKLP